MIFCYDGYNDYELSYYINEDSQSSICEIQVGYKITHHDSEYEYEYNISQNSIKSFIIDVELHYITVYHQFNKRYYSIFPEDWKNFSKTIEITIVVGTPNQYTFRFKCPKYELMFLELLEEYGHVQ